MAKRRSDLGSIDHLIEKKQWLLALGSMLKLPRNRVDFTQDDVRARVRKICEGLQSYPPHDESITAGVWAILSRARLAHELVQYGDSRWDAQDPEYALRGYKSAREAFQTQDPEATDSPAIERMLQRARDFCSDGQVYQAFEYFEAAHPFALRKDPELCELFVQRAQASWLADSDTPTEFSYRMPIIMKIFEAAGRPDILYETCGQALEERQQIWLAGLDDHQSVDPKQSWSPHIVDAYRRAVHLSASDEHTLSDEQWRHMGAVFREHGELELARCAFWKCGDFDELEALGVEALQAGQHGLGVEILQSVASTKVLARGTQSAIRAALIPLMHQAAQQKSKDAEVPLQHWRVLRELVKDSISE